LAFVNKLEASFEAFLDSWRREIIDGKGQGVNPSTNPG
jgi:hypothetical protein